MAENPNHYSSKLDGKFWVSKLDLMEKREPEKPKGRGHNWKVSLTAFRLEKRKGALGMVAQKNTKKYNVKEPSMAGERKNGCETLATSEPDHVRVSQGRKRHGKLRQPLNGWREKL